MFTVYHSNQLDLLARLLVAIMAQKPLDCPLQKELILVQSPGMAQWLKLALAKEQGIVANIDFPLPATFIWQMFTKILPDVPVRSFFNKEAMSWKLMSVLPLLLDEPEFFELKQYLSDDSDNQKLYQLSGKIADIFDQYLVYRPQWIMAWEKEQAVSELEQEQPWQAILWRALYDKTLDLGQSPFHRANLYDDFIETLNSHREKPAGLAGIERIFIFGISALPPRYLHALKALGEHIDVHYLFTNPCRYFWGDIRDKRYLAKRTAADNIRVSRESKDDEAVVFSTFNAQQESALVGNSLLASMGKLGRDNLLLLSELQCREIDQGFVEINRDSLLHHIQADILDLIEAGDIQQIQDSHAKQEININDSSLIIEQCHSPMREVEVLYDRLLEMLEQDNSLTPRDIIVMVADINAYSPAISAVFGNAPNNRFIPFSISDRSADQESPILSTFLRLLNFTQSRCSASELLELLELPCVLRRFGLDNSQFEKLKLWIEEAGIRWGLDETTAAHFSLPDQYQNTWLFGLDRMLLGYAMASGAGLYHDILPYDEVQGLEADIAGKLTEFFYVVSQGQAKLMIEQSGLQWVKTLTSLFDDLFLLEADEEPAGQFIRKQLDNWLIQLDDAGFSEPLSLAIVHDYLKERLSTERISQRFLSGRVNFCTLMPMRSIPFSVVCLLGMNDGQYPRSIAPLGFDLMVNRACAGDRSRRDDDRYLFLEALQSAEQRLYISYIGRSIQDNSKKNPSVLVNELLEYCCQGYCLEGDRDLPEQKSSQRLLQFLVNENSLVPFSRRCFEGARASYAAQWLNAAKDVLTTTQSISTTFLPSRPLLKVTLNDDNLLELAELQRFWRAPVAYFFNRRLNVYFDELSGAMPETEPFALTNLNQYQLRDALLAHMIANGNAPASMDLFYQRQRACGQLPLNYFGALAFENEQLGIADLYQKLQPYLQGNKEALEINLSLNCQRGNILLQGWLDERYAKGRILYRAGKIRAKDRLSSWIEHLCLCAVNEPAETHFLGTNKHISYQPLTKEQAIEQLIFYIDHYFDGIDLPCPYLPETALAGLEVCIDKKIGWQENENTREKAYKKMQSIFLGQNKQQGEGDNLYISRVWPSLSDDLLKQMFSIGKAILLPSLLNDKNNNKDESN